MAYHATLNIEGHIFDVVRCEFSILRDVDTKGRPSSNLYGGIVSVVIESTDDTTIFDLMASQSTPNSGTITFKKDEADEMKKISWKNGFIVDFEEGMTNVDGSPMSIRFTVSVQTLTVGGVTIEQNWPKM
jgi:hypothetical protein